jgi:hypothetical protein
MIFAIAPTLSAFTDKLSLRCEFTAEHSPTKQSQNLWISVGMLSPYMGIVKLK